MQNIRFRLEILINIYQVRGLYYFAIRLFDIFLKIIRINISIRESNHIRGLLWMDYVAIIERIL